MNKARLLLIFVFVVMLSVVDGVFALLTGLPQGSPVVIGALSVILGYLMVEEDG